MGYDYGDKNQKTLYWISYIKDIKIGKYLKLDCTGDYQKGYYTIKELDNFIKYTIKKYNNICNKNG